MVDNNLPQSGWIKQQRLYELVQADEVMKETPDSGLYGEELRVATIGDSQLNVNS